MAFLRLQDAVATQKSPVRAATGQVGAVLESSSVSKGIRTSGSARAPSKRACELVPCSHEHAAELSSALLTRL